MHAENQVKADKMCERKGIEDNRGSRKHTKHELKSRATEPDRSTANERELQVANCCRRSVLEGHSKKAIFSAKSETRSTGPRGTVRPKLERASKQMNLTMFL